MLTNINATENREYNRPAVVLAAIKAWTFSLLVVAAAAVPAAIVVWYSVKSSKWVDPQCTRVRGRPGNK